MNLLSHHVLRDHVLVGGIAALCFVPFWGGYGSLIFWMSTVLVDMDHYLHYLVRNRFRKPGIPSMFRFHEEIFKQRNREEFLALEIFHTVEFMVLLSVVTFLFGGMLLPAFWGIVFHIVIDLIHLTRFGILRKRCHSLFEYFWRRRQFLAQGKDPKDIFIEALKAAGRCG